jgi:hypothetical protein
MGSEVGVGGEGVKETPPISTPATLLAILHFILLLPWKETDYTILKRYFGSISIGL